MAKSLRSKWRRKCRAVKRVRYGEKELARLKKTLGIDENKPVDTVMEDLTEVANVVTAENLTKTIENDQTVEQMDDGTVKRVYDPKTMRDQFGNYPIWMNKRRLLKKRKQNKMKNNKKQLKKKNKRKH